MSVLSRGFRGFDLLWVVVATVAVTDIVSVTKVTSTDVTVDSSVARVVVVCRESEVLVSGLTTVVIFVCVTVV